VSQSAAPDPDNIPADLWFKWLKAAQWDAHQERLRKAIAKIKPRKKKPKVQMPGVQTLDYPKRDPKDPPDCDLP